MTVFELLLKLAAQLPQLKIPQAPGPDKMPRMTSPEGVKTQDIDPNYTYSNFNVSKTQKYAP